MLCKTSKLFVENEQQPSKHTLGIPCGSLDKPQDCTCGTRVSFRKFVPRFFFLEFAKQTPSPSLLESAKQTPFCQKSLEPLGSEPQRALRALFQREFKNYYFSAYLVKYFWKKIFFFSCLFCAWINALFASLGMRTRFRYCTRRALSAASFF